MAFSFYNINKKLNGILKESVDKSIDEKVKDLTAEDGSWGMSEAVTNDQQFVDYVMSFYGPGGVYDMDVEHDDVVKAVELYKKTSDIPFDGDSIDRENVRDILIDKFGYEFPTNESDHDISRMQELANIKDKDMVDEADVEEGNEFSGELAAAKATGKKEFSVGGKTYPVKEGNIQEGRIGSVEASEILDTLGIRGKNFFELRSEQVENLLDYAKKLGYKKSKNAPGSTGRMFYQYLERLADKNTQSIDEGSMKDAMWRDAERMERAEFCDKYGNEEWVGEFWDNIMGDLDESVNEGAPSDEHAVRELVLFADNDADLYRQSYEPIIKNLQRKVNRGVYDVELARKLWTYHAERAAKSYAQQHGDGTPWNRMFSPEDRRAAAAQFEEQAREEIGAEAMAESQTDDAVHRFQDKQTAEKMRRLSNPRDYFESVLNQSTVSEDEDVLESLRSMLDEEEGRPYVVVHARKGKTEVTAGSSYEAAKKAAAKWGLKNTAGVDAYLADVKHDAVDEDSTTVASPSNPIRLFNVNGMAESKKAKMPMDFSKAIKHVVDPEQREEVTKYQTTGRLDHKKFKEKFLKKKFPGIELDDNKEKVDEAAVSRQYNGDGTADAHSGTQFEADTSSSGGSITRKSGVTRHSAGSRYSAMDAETGPDDTRVKVAGRGRGRPVAPKAPEYSKMNDPFGRVGTAPRGGSGTVIKGKNTVDDNSELEEHGGGMGKEHWQDVSDKKQHDTPWQKMKTTAVKEHGGIPNPSGKSWQSMKPSKRSWQTMKEEGAKPDFLDLDRDGDKTEPMKKAVADKKKAPKELDEKATSKKQQKFMGMVHAAQKGEKPASKAVADVAKSMGKGDVKDFAATKHRGLPEKVREGDNVMKIDNTAGAKETQTQPGSNKPGMEFGGGIYENFDEQIEKLINESLSINVSQNIDDNGEPTKNVSVTASGDDAEKLAQILSLAGITGGVQPTVAPEPDSVEVQTQPELSFDVRDFCPVCDCAPCECGTQDDEISFELDEADVSVTDNEPDWPTNQETSDDALQYSGGLNKPKSTGQTTTPVIASQLNRQHAMESTTDIERSLFDTWKNYRG